MKKLLKKKRFWLLVISTFSVGAGWGQATEGEALRIFDLVWRLLLDIGILVV